MKMRALPSWILPVSITVVMVTNAFAQENTRSVSPDSLRIAIVDMKRAFEAHPDTIAEQTKVAEERAAIKAEIKAETEKLKKVIDQYQLLTIAIERGGKKEVIAKKQTEAAQLAEKASQMERDLAKLTSTRETEVERRILTLRKEIIAKIKTTITTLNKNDKYHLILDASATGGNGLPMILDTRKIDDITEDVIKAFQASR